MWNSVVHDMPNLWSSMSITLKSSESEKAMKLHQSDRLLAAVHSVLRLSEDSPLFLQIYTTGPLEQLPAFVLVLQCLVAECYRWQTIRLNVSTLLYDEVFLPISGKLPSLRSLELVGMMKSFPAGRSLALSHETPELRSIQFFAGPLNENILQNIAIPWSQITFLMLSVLGISEVCVAVKNILDHATNLRTLSLG